MMRVMTASGKQTVTHAAKTEDLMENDMKNETHRYDDIINLPHHVSKTHPQMPVADRAAQFAPFAALTGHSDAIKETQRRMEERAAHEYDGEEYE